MKENKSMCNRINEKYIEVFPQFSRSGLTGFFSLKDGASEGYPYSREDVFRENGLEGAVAIWPKQVHKDNIEIIAELPAENLKLTDTDGLITDVRGVLLTTVHADCLPVYFFDPEKKVIALVHAGWRGTVMGIAAKAAKKMTEAFECDKENIYAYIGPGISRCCFEVDEEVYKQFKEKEFFTEDMADKKPAGKYNIDLKAVNKNQLEATGLLSENIEISSHCTCCEPQLFCSYRREGGTYKRMGAGLCIL